MILGRVWGSLTSSPHVLPGHSPWLFSISKGWAGGTQKGPKENGWYTCMFMCEHVFIHVGAVDTYMICMYVHTDMFMCVHVHIEHVGVGVHWVCSQ